MRKFLEEGERKKKREGLAQQNRQGSLGLKRQDGEEQKSKREERARGDAMSLSDLDVCWSTIGGGKDSVSVDFRKTGTETRRGRQVRTAARRVGAVHGVEALDGLVLELLEERLGELGVGRAEGRREGQAGGPHRARGRDEKVGRVRRNRGAV
jgi:hypothetical protein